MLFSPLELLSREASHGLQSSSNKSDKATQTDPEIVDLLTLEGHKKAQIDTKNQRLRQVSDDRTILHFPAGTHINNDAALLNSNEQQFCNEEDSIIRRYFKTNDQSHVSKEETPPSTPFLTTDASRPPFSKRPVGTKNQMPFSPTTLMLRKETARGQEALSSVIVVDPPVITLDAIQNWQKQQLSSERPLVNAIDVNRTVEEIGQITGVSPEIIHALMWYSTNLSQEYFNPRHKDQTILWKLESNEQAASEISRFLNDLQCIAEPLNEEDLHESESNDQETHGISKFLYDFQHIGEPLNEGNEEESLKQVFLQGETMIKALLSSLHCLHGRIDDIVIRMIQTALTTIRQAAETHWQDPFRQRRHLELGIHYMKMTVDILALILQFSNISSLEE